MLTAYLGATLLFGCGGTITSENATQVSQTTEDDSVPVAILKPGTYDSADTAVLSSIDEKKQTMTFYNPSIDRKYTLTFDGTTRFYDKYKEALSVGQVETGSIVDITFLKNNKKLNTLILSPQAWTFSDVSRFAIDEDHRIISLGDDFYKYTEELLIMQGNQVMTLMDINTIDNLSVQGIDKTVYSIRIDDGHGYLRLTGDEYFIGGFIEVGNSQIREITEGMLLTVPAGSYDVTVSKSGQIGTVHVDVAENEEMTVDISEFKSETIVKEGKILFTVSPEDAVLYVDGKEVDTSKPVSLEYGIHQIMAKKAGYKTSSSYLRVSSESAGISVTLDKEDEVKDTSTSTVSGNETQTTPTSTQTTTPTSSTTSTETPSDTETKTVSGNDSGSSSVTDTTSSYYKVYIDSPAGAEVYVDGNYVGIAPVSFKKEEGIRVVTLRKNGYATRSYTINVDSEKKDVSYSFSELIKNE